MAIEKEVLDQLTAEDIELIAGTKVGTDYITRKVDSAVGKGIETFKSGKMLEHINTAVAKEKAEWEKAQNPELTPIERELKELKEQFAKQEAEKKMSALKQSVLKRCVEDEMEADLALMAISSGVQNEEEAVNAYLNLKVLADKYAEKKHQKKLNEKIDKSKRTPSSSSGAPKTNDFDKAIEAGDMKSAVMSFLEE